MKIKPKGDKNESKETVGGFHKSPVGKQIHGPHNQEGRDWPYGRCRNKISKLWSHFSSLLLSSHFSSLLLAQTCFSIAPPGSVVRKERFLLVGARAQPPLKGLAGSWDHLKTKRSLCPGL